jgi:hypothetical protein
MALITLDEVQPWLEESKLRLAQDDELVEEVTASPLVLGKLAARFDTSTWVDENTTPEIVRKCIAMLCAAWRYNKHYSESEDGAGNPYANKLERMVWGDPPDFMGGIIGGILAGSIDIGTVDGPAAEGTIAFYPTDAAEIIDEGQAAKFSMGKVF